MNNIYNLNHSDSYLSPYVWGFNLILVRQHENIVYIFISLSSLWKQDSKDHEGRKVFVMSQHKRENCNFYINYNN